jgi:hypothetical protein
MIERPKPGLFLVPSTFGEEPEGLASGSEPPHDGGMEARIARLESTTEHILRELVDIKLDLKEIRRNTRTDFLWIIGGFATILAVMAHGFHWV